MRGWGGSLAVSLAGIALAGCAFGSAATPAAPSASASVAPAPTGTPAPDCLPSEAEEASQPTVFIEALGGISFDLHRGPAQTLGPVQTPYGGGRAILLGGRSTTGSVANAADELGWSLVSARAALRLNGETIGHDVAVRAAGTHLTFDIPDLDADGQLWVETTWLHGCVAYDGNVAADVQVVSRATTGACPWTDDQIHDWAQQVADATIRVGGTDFSLNIYGYQAKFSDSSASSDFPSFALWKAKLAPTSGAAGGSVVISESNADFDITAISAAFYRRTAVTVGGAPAVLFHATATKALDGRWTVALPSAAGQYVVELQTTIDGVCVEGAAQEDISIDVH